MRIKKRFPFNEAVEAEYFLENGFETKGVDYGAMYVIAKYFRSKFGYGRVKLEKALISICKEHDPNFNPVVEAGTIKKWVNVAMRYALREIEKVYISNEDVSFLRSIEKQKDRKILFATLVLAKAIKKANEQRAKKKKYTSDRYYIWYSSLIDIAKLTKLTRITETKVAMTLHKYKAHFTFYPPEKELIRVDFITEGKDVPITHMEDIMLDYAVILSKGKCEICGKPMERRSNRQKYCPECSPIEERKRKAKWKRENDGK